MTRNCHCGGTYRRTDIVRDPRTGLYRDTDTLAAHWRCDKCGNKRLQRKRQPAKK